MAPVVTTLTKVLHRYGDVEITETMRFANRQSAESFRTDMVGKRIKTILGGDYTVTSVSF